MGHAARQVGHLHHVALVVVAPVDDVLVGDQSLRALARTQASGEIRILESIKLLVPVDGTTLGNITYAEIQQEFPLPVQLSIVKKIAEVVSH